MKRGSVTKLSSKREQFFDLITKLSPTHPLYPKVEELILQYLDEEREALARELEVHKQDELFLDQWIRDLHTARDGVSGFIDWDWLERYCPRPRNVTEGRCTARLNALYGYSPNHGWYVQILPKKT